MGLSIYLITGIVSVIVAGIMALFDLKISAGVILSAVFSIINLALLSFGMKMAISSKESAYPLIMFGNIIRYGLLLLCMYIAYKMPQYFSLIGVAIGFTLFMVALLIDAVRKRKE